jgi:hypothetical protein
LNRTHQRLLVTLLAGISLLTLVGYVVGQKNRRPTLSLPQHDAASSHASRSAGRSKPTADTVDPEKSRPIRPDLFSAPDPPAEPTRLTAVRSVSPLPLPAPAAPEPPDPLADYVYNGTVVQDGEITALIEHRTSKQGWYVARGDTWLNYPIVNVSEQAVTVLVDGKERTLPKSDVINLVPLKAGTGMDSQPPALAASDASESYEALTRWNLGITFSRISRYGGLSEAEIAKIKDDVFEGRITGEEGERRLAQGRAIDAEVFFVRSSARKLRLMDWIGTQSE